MSSSMGLVVDVRLRTLHAVDLVDVEDMTREGHATRNDPALGSCAFEFLGSGPFPEDDRSRFLALADVSAESKGFTKGQPIA